MSRPSLVASILALTTLALTTSACSVFAPSGGGSAKDPLGPTTPTGCLTTPPQHLTPGGYYVNGNTICTADGRPHLFHGVDRPSLEWSISGQNMSAADFALMGSWKANAVRIALNQDFWLSASPIYNSGYATLVDTAIGWAEDAGMDVILDLHWSDAGMLGSCTNACQQVMADENSRTFWSEVATRYKDDGRVLFELYNEPHDVGWPIWKSGGTTGMWTAVGMQQLYDAVRATGAENLVVIGGLNWAYDLSQVPNFRIAGYNILYATHPYEGYAERAPTAWDASWGFLTDTDAVIVTEFGGAASKCDGTYSDQVIHYADMRNASWTAWAWFDGGCGFPSLIDDWTGTPTPSGAVVKAALEGY